MIRRMMAMSITRRASINLDHIHCRAICDEIGERLHYILRQDTSELPPHLKYLMARLAEADREPSPSLVPSTEEMMAGRETHAPDRDETPAYADLAAV
jgi:hypothetical protein